MAATEQLLQVVTERCAVLGVVRGVDDSDTG
jgi:hypothetical protein